MKVWVVMGNDFPDAVFDSEEGAKRYCESQKEKDLAEYQRPRIHWRSYEFDLARKNAP